MPFIFPVYSYNAGDLHQGQEVQDDTPLAKGKWRLTFKVSALLPDALFPDTHKKYNDETAPHLPTDLVLGKDVRLLQLDSYPKLNKVVVVVDLKENPIPIALIAGGVLGVGLIAGIFLSLSKVEKVLTLPTTYVIVAVGALLAFKFR